MKKCLDEKKKFRHFTQPSKKILFIGAGASYGARESNINKPPLGPQLLNWLPGAVNQLKNHTIADTHLTSTILDGEKILNQCSTVNFEELVAKSTPSDQINLHRLIQICFRDYDKEFKINYLPTIDLGFQNQTDLYDDLIFKLKIDREPKDWSIVSLNYDILFEQALQRNNVEYYYPYFGEGIHEDQTTLHGLRIFKPHGSINFFSLADDKLTKDESVPESGIPTEYTANKNNTFSLDQPFVFSIKDPYHTDTYSPVMANYAKHKFSNINQRELTKIRRSIFKIIKNTDELWTIGVNPTTQEDDELVYKVLKKPFKKSVFISKDNSFIESKETSKINLIFSNLGLQDFIKNF